jgi:hypothetical protein
VLPIGEREARRCREACLFPGEACSMRMSHDQGKGGGQPGASLPDHDAIGGFEFAPHSRWRPQTETLQESPRGHVLNPACLPPVECPRCQLSIGAGMIQKVPVPTLPRSLCAWRAGREATAEEVGFITQLNQRAIAAESMALEEFPRPAVLCRIPPRCSSRSKVVKTRTRPYPHSQGWPHPTPPVVPHHPAGPFRSLSPDNPGLPSALD